MPSQCRAISAYLLLPIVVVALIEGCGESVQSPPAVQEAVKLSPEQELAALTKKAEAGDADAQFGTGARYDHGNGVPKDSGKAVEWYQKAAGQGHAKAQNNLGAMYKSGEGVPKDAGKAVEWFQKAAAQGIAGAQFNLGSSYADGSGVPKDAAKAAEWYQKAAVQGEPEAQAALGWMYFRGEGVGKDEAKAFEWFLKAGKQGGESSQAYLAWAYWSGTGTNKDRVLGYAWANLAASSNSEVRSTRESYEQQLSLPEKAEGQRLSSNWKKGQNLTREGSNVGGSAESNGKLSKTGTGTIFVVSKAGHAITNQHVAGNCTELRVQGREGLAKLVTDDKVNDLALLQIHGSVADIAPLSAEPGKLRQGEEIVAFGFPLNSVLSSGGNLTPGVVSALTGLGNNSNQIQITAPVQTGSSGSPVLNKKGEVVGIVSMKLDDGKMAKATGQIGQNVNFAVSGQTLKTFLDTHKVAYNNGSGFFSREKSTADLADEARKWTLAIECWK